MQTTATYDQLTAEQKKLAKTLYTEKKRRYMTHGRSITQTTMVFTPQPYLIFTENRTSNLDKHLLDFRKILELLRISEEEAIEQDLSLNLATGAKIRDYMWNRKRMEALDINLTKKERDFIWNFKW